MATVKVFNQSKGSWSKPVIGVDRETFVMMILELMFKKSKFYTHGMKPCEGEWGPLKESDRCMENVEVDFTTIKYSEILDVHYYSTEDFVDPDSGAIVTMNRMRKDPEDANLVKTEVTFEKINLNPRTLLVGIKNLNALIKALKKSPHDHLIPLVEKIIECGAIPSDASDDYTLILKFE